MLSRATGPDRAEDRNRFISGDWGLPPVLATLPDAGRVADSIAEVMFERHRGAYASEGGEVVVFGNDGFVPDRRSRSEVTQVVGVCLRLGFVLDAFGLSHDGYTWALIVSCPGGEHDESLVSLLNQATWDAWFKASGLPRPGDRTRWGGPLEPPATVRARHDWSRDGF